MIKKGVDFNWEKLTPADKKYISDLGLIFIAAPREMSVKRFVELAKHYLPKGNVLLGIARETYVEGFEHQPQFKTLQLTNIQFLIDKVKNSKTPHKIYTLGYEQHNLDAILNEIVVKRVILVNGSWRYTFHNLPAYRTLVNKNIPYKHVSPFINEAEAKEFEKTHQMVVTLPNRGEILNDQQMIEAANEAAKQSFDYSFQTAVTVGRRKGDSYEYIDSFFNRVIPYQTYAMHFGNEREKHFSLPHDTNHYDTVHAEMAVITEAAKGSFELEGITIFINLLPCPNCARTLSQTDISEVVYVRDHSDGYAVKILGLCGKKVRRLVK